MTTTPNFWKGTETANTDTNGIEAQIVSLTNGNFIVLWVEDSDTGPGISGKTDIIGQEYDALGQKIGVEFTAGIPGRDNAKFEAAALSDGGFLIVHEAENASGTSIVSAQWSEDRSSYLSYNIRSASDMAGLGDPSIAVNEDGSYLVSYQVITDTHVQTRGRLVDSDGVPQPEETYSNVADPASAASDGDQQTSSARLSDGTFVVVGHVEDNGSGGGENGLTFRRIDADGEPLSFTRGVGDTTQSLAPDTNPDVAALKNGGFVVTWQQGGTDNDIAFQRYNNAGQEQGETVFVSNDSGADRSTNPSITELKDGGFVITWIKQGVGFGNDSIHGQRFNASGTTNGNEFTIKGPAANVSYSSLDVTVLEDGRIAVALHKDVGFSSDSVEFAIFDPRHVNIYGQSDADDIITAGYGASIVHGDGGIGHLIGTGDDTLYAYGIGDDLRGQKGNDLLVSGVGQDRLDGGADIDTASYATARAGVLADLLFQARNTGEATGDTYHSIEALIGSGFADDLRGSNDANVLRGGDGNDVLNGRGGTDVLFGEDGDDVMIGGAGSDVFHGGSGTDRVNYNASDAGLIVDLQYVDFSTGIALADGFGSIEDLRGSYFSDDLRGDAGDNRIEGLSGNDTLSGRDGADTLIGGAGDDIMRGGDGGDAMFGGTGEDRASYSDAAGGVTADLQNAMLNKGDFALGDTYSQIEGLQGSHFNDSLRGNGADNMLLGLNGNDFLIGRNGDDIMIGGNGDDVMTGGNGADIHRGGAGIDKVNYINAVSGVKVDLQFSHLNTGIAAGDTYVSVENLRGSRSTDDLRGDGGDNKIEGFEGNDFLIGRDGDDELRGGTGDDVLYGGDGADHLVGSAGADAFLFKAPSEGVDTIQDFQINTDMIRLDDAGFSALSPGALGADNFVIGAAALDANDFILYDAGELYYDADGSGAGDAIHFATLQNTAAIDENDFLIF